MSICNLKFLYYYRREYCPQELAQLLNAGRGPFFAIWSPGCPKNPKNLFKSFFVAFWTHVSPWLRAWLLPCCPQWKVYVLRKSKWTRTCGFFRYNNPAIPDNPKNRCEKIHLDFPVHLYPVLKVWHLPLRYLSKVFLFEQEILIKK